MSKTLVINKYYHEYTIYKHKTSSKNESNILSDKLYKLETYLNTNDPELKFMFSMQATKNYKI